METHAPKAVFLSYASQTAPTGCAAVHRCHKYSFRYSPASYRPPPRTRHPMHTRSYVLFFVVALLSLSAAAPIQAAARALKPDDFAAIRDVTDPQFSPDSAVVAYVVKTTDLAKDKTHTNLWIARWDGTSNRALTFGENKQSHPRWSPDGRWLAFLSARTDDNDDDQLWLLPSTGGEAEKITEIKGGIEGFAWAPDSARLVLVVRDPDPRAPDAKTKEQKTVPPLVIERFMFKRDKVGYLTHRYAHLHLLALASRKVEPLTSGRHDDLFPVWSPDGREIAFFSKRAADPDRSDDWSLLAVGAHPGGSERTLAVMPQTGGFIEADDPLAWSPDGQYLACTHGGEPKLVAYATDSLALVPATGGPPRLLTTALDRNITRPQWAADSKSILALIEDDGTVVLARFSVAGGVPGVIVGDQRRVTDFDVSRDGHVAVLTATPDRSAEIFAADSAPLRPLSQQNDAFFAGLRVARVETTACKSADGTEIHGFLVHPLDPPPVGVRPPALLRPHGGPQGQHAAAFSFEAQLFAAHGYLVILPNPRGSTGRGTAFSKAIYADWGHLDVADDLAAVDHVISRGLCDPDRLGVGGWSYGGMAANYIIATTTRFKAATSGSSVANNFAAYGTDQYIRDYEHEFGTPWKNPEIWQRISFPFFHADRIKTPTLFLCGESDFNVPLFNSEQMYQALRSLNVPTQLVIYPGQFHGLTKPSYILDRYQRYLEWYAKYIPSAKSGATATN